MSAMTVPAGVKGLYALTSDGELGFLNAAGRFIVDRARTHALGPQIRQLLRSYLADPDRGDYRLGVIHRTRDDKPWRSDTFVMEDRVLREVCPDPGAAEESRESSVYRGLERLMGHRRKPLTESPVYCPLLYDRGTSLSEYSARHDGEKPIPVVEVLNLMAVTPHGRRGSPELSALMRDVRQSLAVRDARRDVVAHPRHVPVGRGGAGPRPIAATAADAGGGRPARAGDILAGRLVAALREQQRDRFERMEAWRERPQRSVEPELLRGFVRFRDLDGRMLRALAQNAPVYKAPAGVRLLDAGTTDTWNLYLLDGDLSLRAADGGSLVVSGRGEKAASPISSLKPRKYTVISRTPVSFLWIHDAMLRFMALVSDSVDPTAVARRDPRR